MVHRNEWETRRWLEDCNTVDLDTQRHWFHRSSQKYRIAVQNGVEIGLVRVTVTDGVGLVGCDVFSKHRGNGYGHTVFAAACEEAVKLGAKKLELWVFADNFAATAIYSKAGFVIDGNVAVKYFMRPEQEGETPRPRLYLRMARAA